MRLVFSTMLVYSSFVLSFNTPSEAQQIREYQRRFIGDIGYAAVNRQGTPIVVMNPSACRRLGPELCSFFKAHERAHHTLGHFNRNISVQQKEAEADRYAASVVSPTIRAAAQNYFASGRGSSRQHGSSQQRLARVSNSQTTSNRDYGRSRSRASHPANVRLGATNRARRVRIPTPVKPTSCCESAHQRDVILLNN